MATRLYLEILAEEPLLLCRLSVVLTPQPWGTAICPGRLIISLALFARLFVRLFACLFVCRPARQTNPTSGLWPMERLKAVSRAARRDETSRRARCLPA